jgi:hypothetical protein
MNIPMETHVDSAGLNQAAAPAPSAGSATRDVSGLPPHCNYDFCADTYSSSIEMVTIDPRHLQEALNRDRAIP